MTIIMMSVILGYVDFNDDDDDDRKTLQQKKFCYNKPFLKV